MAKKAKKPAKKAGKKKKLAKRKAPIRTKSAKWHSILDPGGKNMNKKLPGLSKADSRKMQNANASASGMRTTSKAKGGAGQSDG